MTIFGLAWWVVTHANAMCLPATFLPSTEDRIEPPPSQTAGQCQDNDTKELTLPCAETLLDRSESESLIPHGWAISRLFCCSSNISCRLSAFIKPLALENLKPKEAKTEAIKWELDTAWLMKWASVRRNVCQVRGFEGGATGFPLKKQAAESKT